ncbi:Rieske 2Fe-2S domain-containing protein [Piscinibacter sakaiensis]|uniref:Ferredoxin subunit of nitrite reductase n=1 Tax=Piscinibacter sakaiensis TaxID=1547922 RepID=A0A0K8NT67_PISS1|nr:Rieske 2Fe-2S domain-containing protein [Piscinibacter sakaiensis]GAP33601.1 ferredoxin subunit of nitrite reductase [Piscinibacter sakaiensis]
MVEAPPGEPPAPREWVCRSEDLVERGKAVLFEVREFRHAVRAFVLRIDGQVVGYLNRCAHVPAEMDWVPGEFLDDSGRYILCAIHGAAYHPADGRCAGGPCGRGRLTALRVEETGGQVYWYPSRDIRPPAPAAESPP